MEKKELIIIPEQAIVKPAGTPQDMEDAIQRYKGLQETLDKAMPDCIMEIQGKHFRKKNYWRAVKTAFNLKVECIKEERLQLPNDDWGFLVTYRAIAPNGASADGDGACTYQEKAKGRMLPTLHNIRSQAHTRSFNRAVSNLVGFGEVSAEEIVEHSEPKKPIQKPIPLKQPETPGDFITPQQLKKIQAQFSEIGISERENRLMWVNAILTKAGHEAVKSSKELTKEQASFVIESLDAELKNIEGGGDDNTEG